MVTDTAIVNSFPFGDVMNQLATQSGVAGLTRLQLYRQWWDTANVKPGLGLGAHCNDTLVAGQPSVNGFPYTCPRAEGAQASQDPFSNLTSPNSYLPIAVVNRFDLAPKTGAHCGEYHIVYARRSG